MLNLKYIELFETLLNNTTVSISYAASSAARNALFKHICDRANSSSLLVRDDVAASLKQKLLTFCSMLQKKWKESHHIETRFRAKHSSWLNREMDVSELEETPCTSRGRPSKPFEELCERNKRRRVKNACNSLSPNEIYVAASSTLYTEGKRAASTAVAKATGTNSKRRLEMENAPPGITPYTEDGALALMMDCRLTKAAYLLMRKGAKDRAADIYPSYHRILEAKIKCYPDEIVNSKYCASIPLQNLLNHTCSRILDTIKSTKHDGYLHECFTLQMLCKWGCDGSSGHNEYMQLFRPMPSEEEPTQNNDLQISEHQIFMFSIVPLKIIGKRENGNDLIFWENPKASSVKYCRPLKFLYSKETAQLSRSEISKTETEIENLNPFDTHLHGVPVSVSYVMILTMLDTKVITALTETASQNCYICGCKPSQMNNLKPDSALQIREENMKYGLSTLHAWIKFLEFILHLSYKINLKKTSLRGASLEERNEVKSRKSAVQKALWEQLSIKVDKVVQGCGTSNTGNVARRFFEKVTEEAEATEVDADLISRFGVILQTLSSGYSIHIENFKEYSFKTAELFVSLYGWYQMPPIGQLSEDAQESRNKDFRRFREHHTRKSSKQNTTEDLIHHLLISSDPVISSLRKKNSTAVGKLHSYVRNLLILDDCNEDCSGSDEDSD